VKGVEKSNLGCFTGTMWKTSNCYFTTM